VRAFAVPRKMKPVQQIEAAEHMIASNNFTLPLLKAILLITKTEMLSDSQPKKGKRSKGWTSIFLGKGTSRFGA
jgi:hypothetical protein